MAPADETANKAIKSIGHAKKGLFSLDISSPPIQHPSLLYFVLTHQHFEYQ
jgi:hypothetical protein